MDLCVWNKCNNKCLMCTNPKNPWPALDGSFDYDYKAIIGRLRKYKDEINLSDKIYLSGGEPTLHPQFLEILRYLKNNFPKIRVLLLSNSRRFYYEDFAKEVLSVNKNFEIDVSLCGHNSKIHDAVTNSPGSFEQVRKGLTNLLKHKKTGQAIGIRHVINSLTYKHMYEFLEYVYNNFSTVDRVIFIFFEIEAMALENLKKIKVTYEQVLPYIKKTSPFIKKIENIRLYHFPLCVLPKEVWPNAWRTLPKDEVVFMPKCSSCLYRDYCLGVPRKYLEIFSNREFKPIKNDQGLITDDNDKYNPIKSIK